MPKRRGVWLAALAAVVIVALVALRPLLGRQAYAVRAQPTELTQTVVVSGRVLSPARVEIGSVQTGRVAEVLVDEGDLVAQGEPLIRLEASELAAAAAQARAAESAAAARLGQLQEVGRPTSLQALRQAEANLEVAEKDLNRQRELVARGFVGQARVDESQRTVTVARAQVESARAQAQASRENGSEARELHSRIAEARGARELAEAKLANATILAPSAGTIVLRSVEPGDVVQPGKGLLSLAVAGETRIVAQVDERNLALIRVGQRAVASADAFPATRFAAEMITLAPAVDPQKGTVEAKLRVTNPPPFLRADMTVSVEIEVGRRTSALVVPLTALRGPDGAPESGARDPGSTAAAVLVGRDGRAELRSVRVGIVAGGRAEVAQGLSPGDAVIVEPAVTPGERVRLRVVAADELPTAAARGDVSGQGSAMGQIGGQQ
jgi:HlyD family secretion protein